MNLIKHARLWIWTESCVKNDHCFTILGIGKVAEKVKSTIPNLMKLGEEIMEKSKDKIDELQEIRNYLVKLSVNEIENNREIIGVINVLKIVRKYHPHLYELFEMESGDRNG
jgi:soluble P-type ATPase